MANQEKLNVFFAAGKGGAREHAMARAIKNPFIDIYTTAMTDNPGIRDLSQDYMKYEEEDVVWQADYAAKNNSNVAVIGSEQPLAAGIVNELELRGIPTVGPTKDAARIESSKLYLRELMQRHHIQGAVEYHHITSEDALDEILSSGKEYALKPLGLTGGKGVRVMGEQLDSVADALAYGREVLKRDNAIILEERLQGPEFTLQAFNDGRTLKPMPLVKDYKKAYEGDVGPNTGSMGSYSREDGLLDFVSEDEKDEAFEILKQVSEAMKADGNPFKGILYGQFMKTKDGLKLIEINSRFGDPEGINILSLLKTDFANVCAAIVNEELDELEIEFEEKATVVKYIAPPGYPESPEEDVEIEIDEDVLNELGVEVFYAQVKSVDGKIKTTRSRYAAILGKGKTVDEAERKVEEAVRHVEGRFHMRHDIGTEELMEQDRAILL